MAQSNSETHSHHHHQLSIGKQILLGFASLLLVAFGQPAWSWLAGIAAAVVGYALIWRVLLCYEKASHRFWIAAGWYAVVQLIQLSWFISHPYLYIWAVYFLLSFFLALQFGLIGVLITWQRVTQWSGMLLIASLWTLLEWIRLFVFSGFSWNPAGIALTGSLYSLQAASLFGAYGLTFWVMFVNLLFLRAWGRPVAVSLAIFAAALPYIYGAIHLNIRSAEMEKYHEAKGSESTFAAMLVQPAFPVEEALGITDPSIFLSYVIDEWRHILKITKKHQGQKLDLIVMPEFFVPYGTYSFMFPYLSVVNSFKELLGPDSIKALPPLKPPLAHKIETADGHVWAVNNAYWSQAIANYFQTDLVLGLEDAEDNFEGIREYYSAAYYFHADGTLPQRYEKRILVPMGEYIPFTFLKQLAAQYGIQGSFTCGTCAKVFEHPKAPFGVSICYEETFGHMTRENRIKGAEILVNITNDAWFPTISQQHFDHARLRTVESGIPLLRACNTGVTGAIDSLGRVIATIGKNAAEAEHLSEALLVKVSTYTYHTLYSRFGDKLIIGFCLLVVAFSFLIKKVFFK